MLHTLPSCPCTRNNCYILKNIKKSWKCQHLFAVISQKWAMGKNFHFSSNFGLETHPAVLREYAFYPPPPVQPPPIFSHPPIVYCIVYYVFYMQRRPYYVCAPLFVCWSGQPWIKLGEPSKCMKTNNNLSKREKNDPLSIPLPYLLLFSFCFQHDGTDIDVSVPTYNAMKQLEWKMLAKRRCAVNINWNICAVNINCYIFIALQLRIKFMKERLPPCVSLSEF